jgi:DNA adenine methylase
MKQFSTPLRYPGGKGKLTNFIKLVFEQNNLIGGEYMEPYAGGAGIALSLLFDGYASRIHLNDLNPAVFAFWHSVLFETKILCDVIQKVDVSMDEWYRQKAILLEPQKHSLLELGFATFFLNRTNRSGILLGGVIGGKAQAGEWKLDARFNKNDLISRIEKISQHKDQIQLHHLDAARLIPEIIPSLPKQTLVYLDPPYYIKGKGLYENHYKHEDHLEIAKLVKKHIRLPWIVSYDYVPEIMDMYEQDYRPFTYGINYSAQNRYQGAEVMFFSKKMTVPDIQNPSKLKLA